MIYFILGAIIILTIAGVIYYKNFYNKTININDINWNGKELQNGNLPDSKPVQINNADDLIHVLEDIKKEIYVLSAAVVSLGSK